MKRDPDGGWGRLGAGLVLVAFGLAFLLPTTVHWLGEPVDPIAARSFGAVVTALGVYQVARGWGFDVEGWRARRRRLRALRVRRR